MGNLSGLYRGIVTETADPERRGRVRVEVPVVGPNALWASPCVPYASGSTALEVPPVGTEVWVAFEQGDPDRPVWMGVPGR